MAFEDHPKSGNQARFFLGLCLLVAFLVACTFVFGHSLSKGGRLTKLNWADFEVDGVRLEQHVSKLKHVLDKRRYSVQALKGYFWERTDSTDSAPGCVDFDIDYRVRYVSGTKLSHGGQVFVRTHDSVKVLEQLFGRAGVYDDSGTVAHEFSKGRIRLSFVLIDKNQRVGSIVLKRI